MGRGTTGTKTKVVKSNGAGRPTKLNTHSAEVIFDALRRAVPFKYACGLAGISEKTGHTWLNNNPEFHSQVQDMKAFAVSHYVTKTGEKDPKFILKNIAKEDFKEHIEIEGRAVHELLLTLPDGTKLPAGNV